MVEQEEEDTINIEGVRQKEYLERVVASQKHQLKQMEKLHKKINTKWDEALSTLTDREHAKELDEKHRQNQK